MSLIARPEAQENHRHFVHSVHFSPLHCEKKTGIPFCKRRPVKRYPITVSRGGSCKALFPAASSQSGKADAEKSHCGGLRCRSDVVGANPVLSVAIEWIEITCAGTFYRNGIVWGCAVSSSAANDHPRSNNGVNRKVSQQQCSRIEDRDEGKRMTRREVEAANRQIEIADFSSIGVVCREGSGIGHRGRGDVPLVRWKTARRKSSVGDGYVDVVGDKRSIRGAGQKQR